MERHCIMGINFDMIRLFKHWLTLNFSIRDHQRCPAHSHQVSRFIISRDWPLMAHTTHWRHLHWLTVEYKIMHIISLFDPK